MKNSIELGNETGSGGDPVQDAYDLLAEFGVRFGSTMLEVHRAGIEAQRRGALTPARSQAWRELRDPGKRLAIDLFRLQSDPGVFGTELPAQPDRWGLSDEIVGIHAEIRAALPLPESFLEEPI